MRFILFLGVLLVSVLASASVMAVEKGLTRSVDEFGKEFHVFGKYIWGPVSHDETRLYLNSAKIPHSSRWDEDHWTPQTWIDRRGGSAMNVINGFYKAGIVLDQYTEDDTPVLVVGHSYIELSPLEQRRVAAFFDHVFRITASHPAGMFDVVYHAPEDKMMPVGIFTEKGLQLR